MFSGHVAAVSYRRVMPWHEIVDLTIGMAVDDFGEDVVDVGERIDAAELGCLDKRCDERPMLAAGI
jgi:hypothetical protein